jgi:hypothetical protein
LNFLISEENWILFFISVKFSLRIWIEEAAHPYAVLLAIDLVSCPCGATRELSSRTITLKAYPGPSPPPPHQAAVKKVNKFKK